MEREHSLVERLTRFSINRRISVLVLLVSVIVVGGVAASGMPVELFPQENFIPVHHCLSRRFIAVPLDWL